MVEKGGNRVCLVPNPGDDMPAVGSGNPVAGLSDRAAGHNPQAGWVRDSDGSGSYSDE